MQMTKEYFLKTIADHRMTIMQDEGIFRHIVFSRPDSGSYRFHLTTFPEHLVITGDCGSYVFRRLYDMFVFFRTEELKIDDGYWAEKTVAKDRWNPIMEYCPEKVKAIINEYFEEWVNELNSEEEREAARVEFKKKILDECETEDGFNRLGYVQLDCGYTDEYYEYSTRDYTDEFRWCLYAIAWGIQQYDDAKSTHDDGGSK